MANEQNPKPFPKGVSGNPSGRPKKRPISDRYAEIAEMPLEESIRQALKLPKGAKYGHATALAQARSAIKGKTDAAREMREAIEGKATQRIELSDTTMADAFDKMSNEELDAYARDSTLPDWFPRTNGSK
jgi:hypothetical protein